MEEGKKKSTTAYFQFMSKRKLVIQLGAALLDLPQQLQLRVRKAHVTSYLSFIVLHTIFLKKKNLELLTVHEVGCIEFRVLGINVGCIGTKSLDIL